MSSGGVRGDVAIDAGDVVFECEISGVLGVTSSSSTVREAERCAERGNAAGDGEIYRRAISLGEVGGTKRVWEMVDTDSAVVSGVMTRDG